MASQSLSLAPKGKLAETPQALFALTNVFSAGYLVARGDFPEPIGPAFWNMGRG